MSRTGIVIPQTLVNFASLTAPDFSRSNECILHVIMEISPAGILHLIQGGLRDLISVSAAPCFSILS